MQVALSFTFLHGSASETYSAKTLEDVFLDLALPLQAREGSSFPKPFRIEIFITIPNSKEVKIEKLRHKRHMSWQIVCFRCVCQDSDCHCGGPWAKFHKLLNFTFAHSSGNLAGGISKPLQSLCYEKALPMLRSVLSPILHTDGALKQANLGAMMTSEYMHFGEHYCPSGLVAALSLCAAVHAHKAQEMEQIRRLRPEVIPKVDPLETEADESINWQLALGSWTELLPTGCERHVSCLAYLEVLLALQTIRYCGLCITEKEWLFTADEVNENAIRWLRWLWHRGAYTVPPLWEGPSSEKRVQPAMPWRVAGAFAGPSRGAPEDGSGATEVLRKLAAQWRPKQVTTRRYLGRCAFEIAFMFVCVCFC